MHGGSDGGHAKGWKLGLRAHRSRIGIGAKRVVGRPACAPCISQSDLCSSSTGAYYSSAWLASLALHRSPLYRTSRLAQSRCV